MRLLRKEEGSVLQILSISSARDLFIKLGSTHKSTGSIKIDEFYLFFLSLFSCFFSFNDLAGFFLVSFLTSFDFDMGIPP